MDKEAFLHQLESSLANSDKRLFAKTIYDLPVDVIVGYTKEDFSRIIYISHHFSSQKMDRLSNFLEIKGLFFLKNALKGVDELNNYLLSKSYYTLYISLSGNNKEKVKRVLGNNAIACCKLAEIGIDSRENLETAVSLCGKVRQIYPQKSEDCANALIYEGNARLRLAEMGIDNRENLETAVSLYEAVQEILSKTSASYAHSLVNEGAARQTLAEMGIDSRENLETAVHLYGKVQELIPKTGTDYATALMNEGNARKALADMGIDSKENLETAVHLYGDAKEIFPKTSTSYARVLGNEGFARSKLAEMGIDSRENLETAVSLCGNARHILSKTSADYARALINEGNARKILADMGIDSRENLETAVSLYSDAEEIFPKTSASYARALMNEGSARSKLAGMGIDSRENLETAVSLCGNARHNLSKTSADYARALMNEGSARSKLAEMSIDSRENLETAVSLYGDVEEIFSKTSTDYARTLMNEGNARLKLAYMGIDSRKNLETAVSLYGDVEEIFPKKSTFYALALMNEGSARSILAEMGIDSRENLETAVRFYMNSREILLKTSADYGRSLMNEGNARVRLAQMNIDSQENLNKSKKLYLDSISILEKLGDGWTYSISILNYNNLLKENFYKTGDKKHLEEWERNLGDIEEKIKSRDIWYKEIVMARIHEIRASLFEFEGNSGIYEASLEYKKAYELSKDQFYMFMNEFSQARIKIKSFCKLVSDWKDIEKEGIFLDYYDYTIFECYLENALKSTINEEEELKFAVEKLTEIKDRTQIKIIKDRVAAYIHLLQALVYCFNKDSYKEAAENVKEGCKIFREYGDKQGQQTCEIFHNAVVKKRDPNAWQEIIRNREFSSNFYSLLCEYSERKRANLELYMSGQLHAKMDTISENVEQVKEISIRNENKTNEILNQMRSGFSEIKNQIVKGFKGTNAELQQIIDKIDNSQQDLKYLVQVSNKMDSKEGKCIREFSSQMFELLKKGDSEALKRFNEKIIQNSSSIIEIIEASNIPERQKIEAKSKLSSFKKIPSIVKKKAKSFSVDVTKDVVVTLTSNEIIKLLTPVLSTAIFGVPIPSKVMEILLEAIRN